jgi:hypothetical protein
VVQPLVAILLGTRAGLTDARAGRPPYILAVVAHPGHRREMLGQAVNDLTNIVLMGILLDTVSQWLMLGVAYPFAALVVGPVLIAFPYSVARALANRAGRRLVRG